MTPNIPTQFQENPLIILGAIVGDMSADTHTDIQALPGNGYTCQIVSCG